MKLSCQRNFQSSFLRILFKFLLFKCFLIISLFSNSSKYSLGLQAIVRRQGLSILLILKYLKHLCKNSFLRTEFVPVLMRRIKTMVNFICDNYLKNYFSPFFLLISLVALLMNENCNLVLSVSFKI